jgi:hypothetical protein
MQNEDKAPAREQEKDGEPSTATSPQDVKGQGTFRELTPEEYEAKKGTGIVILGHPIPEGYQPKTVHPPTPGIKEKPREEYVKGRGLIILGYPKPPNVEWYKPPTEPVKDPVLSTTEQIEQEHQNPMADFEKGLTQEQQQAWANARKVVQEVRRVLANK